jgi:hypothetical protein
MRRLLVSIAVTAALAALTGCLPYMGGSGGSSLISARGAATAGDGAAALSAGQLMLPSSATRGSQDTLGGGPSI